LRYISSIARIRGGHDNDDDFKNGVLSKFRRDEMPGVLIIQTATLLAQRRRESGQGGQAFVRWRLTRRNGCAIRTDFCGLGYAPIVPEMTLDAPEMKGIA
jgi:hypothetical protein